MGSTFAGGGGVCAAAAGGSTAANDAARNRANHFPCMTKSFCASEKHSILPADHNAIRPTLGSARRSGGPQGDPPCVGSDPPCDASCAGAKSDAERNEQRRRGGIGN